MGASKSKIVDISAGPSASHRPTSLLRLPATVLQNELAAFLDVEEIVTLQCTNKSFFNILNDDAVWQAKVPAEANLTVVRELVLRSVATEMVLPHRAFPDQRAFLLQRRGAVKYAFSFLRFDITQGADEHCFDRPDVEDSWFERCLHLKGVTQLWIDGRSADALFCPLLRD